MSQSCNSVWLLCAVRRVKKPRRLMFCVAIRWQACNSKLISHESEAVLRGFKRQGHFIMIFFFFLAERDLSSPDSLASAAVGFFSRQAKSPCAQLPLPFSSGFCGNKLCGRGDVSMWRAGDKANLDMSSGFQPLLKCKSLRNSYKALSMGGKVQELLLALSQGTHGKGGPFKTRTTVQLIYPLTQNIKAIACVLSRVWLFVILWTVAHQAPLSMGILQARILEWVAVSSSRGSSWPWDQTRVFGISCTGRQVLYHWATWEVHKAV